MNLPNKITLFRVLLVPVFVVLMLLDESAIPYRDIIACVVFCVACISDFFDGYLARKMNIVTNFGKFMDPLADKLLVCSALILFIELDRIPAWVVIIIIAREFIISGIRLIAAGEGKVIAANMLGKVKTNAQMFMAIFMILNIDNSVFRIITDVLMWASVILTVVSLVEYTYSNRKFFVS
ncbi:MAG: CDP-diacylglycerol--glycerol-3-phosphate 3-phosphatidyltransferase [Lachnospiraceae bacterium]|nr:CDP-diacylglycerol--glycerol-3-phosphate 3-phosphatidyltransferase [Lachnospiraceae bacterium]